MMNFISIIIGVLVVVALVAAIGAMNKGNSPCGGNCSTCVMSEHCEKQEDAKAAMKESSSAATDEADKKKD